MITPDNKLVVAVEVESGGTSGPGMTVIRLLADGTMDAGFGSGGRTTLDFVGPMAVALDPNGQVVAAGAIPGATSNNPTPAAVIRLTNTGQLDASFGGSGQVPITGLPVAVGVDDARRIIVATVPKFWFGVQLLRLHPDGSSDASWGGGGVVAAGGMSFGAMLVRPDGTVTTAVRFFAVASFINVYGPYTTKLTTYDATGAVVHDTTLSPCGLAPVVSGLVETPDGGTIAASGRLGLLLLAVRPDGTADPGFGPGGIVSIDPGRLASGYQFGAIALAPDGAVLTAGLLVDVPRVDATTPETGRVLVARTQTAPASPGVTSDPVAGCPGSGYWLVAADGGIFSFGDIGYYGSTGALQLNAAVVGMARTPTGDGYWLVAADGGIFSFGDAPFLGSTGALHLNAPIVGIVPMPPVAHSRGYWLVAADGGIFNFGDAGFFGSTGNLRLNAPIVGMTATPTGDGYWLVAADGGVFNFGDADFFGSTGNLRLNAPIVGMAATAPAYPDHPSGFGYWLVAKDGGIFSFGDAKFHGSAGALALAQPIVTIVPTASAGGYWLVAKDGGIFSFGDARFFGSTGATHLNQPIVGMAFR